MCRSPPGATSRKGTHSRRPGTWAPGCHETGRSQPPLDVNLAKKVRLHLEGAPPVALAGRAVLLEADASEPAGAKQAELPQIGPPRRTWSWPGASEPPAASPHHLNCAPSRSCRGVKGHVPATASFAACLRARAWHMAASVAGHASHTAIARRRKA